MGDEQQEAAIGREAHLAGIGPRLRWVPRSKVSGSQALGGSHPARRRLREAPWPCPRASTSRTCGPDISAPCPDRSSAQRSRSGQGTDPAGTRMSGRRAPPAPGLSRLRRQRAESPPRGLAGFHDMIGDRGQHGSLQSAAPRSRQRPPRPRSRPRRRNSRARRADQDAALGGGQAQPVADLGRTSVASSVRRCPRPPALGAGRRRRTPSRWPRRVGRLHDHRQHRVAARVEDRRPSGQRRRRGIGFIAAEQGDTGHGTERA